MNMSYCRFHNTRRDMSDCLDALRNEERLSKSEAKNAKYMFEDILEYLLDMEVISIDLDEAKCKLYELIDSLTDEDMEDD